MPPPLKKEVERDLQAQVFAAMAAAACAMEDGVNSETANSDSG